MADVQFIDGLRIYKPKDTAPEYIIAEGEIDVRMMREWLANHSDKVRITVKMAKSGKYYACVDNWKPDPSRQRTEQREAVQQAAQSTSKEKGDDLPF